MPQKSKSIGWDDLTKLEKFLIAHTIFAERWPAVAGFDGFRRVADRLIEVAGSRDGIGKTSRKEMFRAWQRLTAEYQGEVPTLGRAVTDDGQDYMAWDGGRRCPAAFQRGCRVFRTPSRAIETPVAVWRKALGWTQEQATAELRVSLRQYKRYESYSAALQAYCEHRGETGVCEALPVSLMRLMQLLSQVHGKA